ncbi:MAG: hypothetical protein IJ189_06730 [Clostridia bacterium]|nr:hypothetical protein [Clostridia bacterium]
MTPEEILQYAHSAQGRCDARNLLSACLHIDAQIALKLAQLDQLREKAKRMPGADPRVIRELEQDVLTDYSALLKQQKRIGDMLRRVPNDLCRTVMEAHYIQELPFFRIAMNLHYDERQIYRLHKQGLEHVAAQLAYERKAMQKNF